MPRSNNGEIANGFIGECEFHDNIQYWKLKNS